MNKKSTNNKSGSTNGTHTLILEEVKGRLNNQDDSIKSLDTKAGITLGFIGAFIGGLVNADWFLGLPFIYLAAIMVSLGISGALAIRAWFARDYQRDPEPTELMNGYWNSSKDILTDQLISNLCSSFDKNLPRIKDKKMSLNYSLGFLTLGIVIVMGALLFLPRSKPNQSTTNQGESMSEDKPSPTPPTSPTPPPPDPTLTSISTHGAKPSKTSVPPPPDTKLSSVQTFSEKDGHNKNG